MPLKVTITISSEIKMESLGSEIKSWESKILWEEVTTRLKETKILSLAIPIKLRGLKINYRGQTIK